MGRRKRRLDAHRGAVAIMSEDDDGDDDDDDNDTLTHSIAEKERSTCDVRPQELPLPPSATSVSTT